MYVLISLFAVSIGA